MPELLDSIPQPSAAPVADTASVAAPAVAPAPAAVSDSQAVAAPVAPDTFAARAPAPVAAADTVPAHPVRHHAYEPVDSAILALQVPAANYYVICSEGALDLATAHGIVVAEEAQEEEIVAELAPEDAWMQGLQGDPRPVNIGDNSGVLSIVAAIFLLMMLSYKRCRRLFSTLWQELLGMRRRASLFDTSTGNETRALMLMALQWCVCTGLLLYSAICNGVGDMPVPPEFTPKNAFADTASLICLTMCYYIFQFLAYFTVGYVFSDSAGRRLYVQGFTASQSLVGFALIVPALASIFYPSVATIMVAVGAGIYALARIIFIVKGLRIFYTNFGSLLYFILYLCALEIIPAILVYKLALILIESPIFNA